MLKFTKITKFVFFILDIYLLSIIIKKCLKALGILFKTKRIALGGYRSKGQHLALFALTWSVTFLYFGMDLPKDGTNQLPKAGFD